MRLATLETSAGPRVVSVVDVDGQQRFVDLTAVHTNLPRSLKGLLALENGLAAAAAAEKTGVVQKAFVEGQLRAPIVSPGKVICIGLNYRDHAEESGMAIPEEPVCFSKFSHTVVGPDANIVLPKVSQQVDYEAELVVVIGKRGKHIAEANALDYVAGYTNGHDVSARDWQLGRPGGQWLMGKTPDTFAPIGPWLVTTDEISDPHNLRIQLRLNGNTLQDSNTKEFIFNIPQVIAYLSQLMTLEPGDIIFTGTPPGVGMARDPQVWLKAGDVAEIEVEGLGILRNPVVDE